MTLTAFTALAATCEIDPGTEAADESGVVQIRDRVFTDRVTSDDPRMAGTNKPRLRISFNPETGEGSLGGTFELTLDSGRGTWVGELNGHFEKGMVRSSGIARGTGPLEGSVLQVRFEQIPEYPEEPPCEDPQAFFKMDGLILE